MKKIISLSICLIILTAPLKSQIKFWVKFSNKNGTPYSLSNPSAFLTAKSIARRTTYNLQFDQSDLPVNPFYVAQIEGVSGVTVLYASKWMNAVAIRINSGSLSNALITINSYPFVMSTYPVNRYKITLPEMNHEILSQERSANRSDTVPAGYYGRSYWQNHQLNVECIHGYGMKGQGMTIAVLDAGFADVNVNPVFDSLRNRGGILGTRDFVAGGNSVYEDHLHGAAVLSCMAALNPGLIVGSAPAADYWLLRTEDVNSETPSEEYNWIRGAEFADSVGADILTTSLGYTEFDNSGYNHTYADLNGKSVSMSLASTMAARKGMMVFNAAGNGGGSSWSKIGIPADADSICTVGGIDSTGALASFSSVGPTADGRIKPDLVARAVDAWVSYQANGNCNPSNGTSFATPILAGAAACFWQAHKDYNNITALNALRNNASQSLAPDNSKGWGVPDMCAIEVGLREKNYLNEIFSVAPNPFSSSFKIRFEKAPSSDIQIQILNTLGSAIKTISVDLKSNTAECDLSDFSSGVYFIRVSTASDSKVKKIIKR